MEQIKKIKNKIGWPAVSVAISFFFFFLSTHFFSLTYFFPSNNADSKYHIKYFIHSPYDDSQKKINDRFNFIPYNSDQSLMINEETWIKISTYNTESKINTLTFYFDNPLIKAIETYKEIIPSKKNNNSILVDKSVFSSKHKEYYPTSISYPPSINLLLLPNEKAKYYFKIHSNEKQSIPFWIVEEKEYDKISKIIHLLWGGFTAIIFISLIYTIINYFITKEILFIVYACFSMTLWVQHSILYGFGYYFIPNDILSHFNSHHTSFYFLNFFFFLAFSKHQTKKTSISIKFKIMHFTSYCFFFLFLYTFTFDVNKINFILLGSLCVLYLLMIPLIYIYWKKNKNWSRALSISWIALLGSSIAPILLTFNIIDYILPYRYIYLAGMIISILFMALSLSERYRAIHKKSLFQIMHDPLSGIPNQHFLTLALRDLIHQHKDFCLCTFQIDRFSSISPYLTENEKFHVIHQTCFLIESQITSLDTHIYEKNGEYSRRVALVKEGVFSIIFLSTDEVKINNILSDLISALDQSIELEHFSINTQGNFGISIYPKDSHHAETLVNKSQQALTTGRKTHYRIHEYDSLNSFNQTLNLSLINDLRHAISHDELALFHQPQINLHNNTIHGSELLVRWKHPKFGHVSPDIFVKLAEEFGFINELTLWVIKHAFSQQKSLLKLGFHHQFSINISASDICIENLVDYIIEMSKKYQVPTNFLTIELTESTMVNDFKKLQNLISFFNQYNINIAIDDYGTGYSSLIYLSQLSFSELKIDREFIQHLSVNTKYQKIVKATSDMATSLGLMIVAEGVEDQKTIDHLIEFGIQIGQGYFFAHPMPFIRYCHFLSEKSLSDNNKEIPIKN